jgi:CheY-like chemotaxis protein
MEQDSLKTIFKPFSQLDKRVNKEYEGIGIGLGIAQKLVEVLGGQLKVKTKIGEGSEFYFKIPIEILEEDKPKKISYEKVLIVEDNKANQIFMKVVLKKLGLDFDIADNGKIAVDLYKNFHYPLILMDINMPILDGIEATKLIRKYEKEHNLSNSKIIAVTATSIDEYGEKIEKAGFDNYISKPVDVDKLLNLI